MPFSFLPFSLSPFLPFSTPFLPPFPDPTSRIKKLTIDEIVDLWNNDLEEHVKSFRQQAMEIKKWDEQLISNGNKIFKLQSQVTQVQKHQQALERSVDHIKTYQKDLYSLVTTLEKRKFSCVWQCI
jgi:septal ring factor EnvC (AmiA/AmiB activator)